MEWLWAVYHDSKLMNFENAVPFACSVMLTVNAHAHGEQAEVYQDVGDMMNVLDAVFHAPTEPL